MGGSLGKYASGQNRLAARTGWGPEQHVTSYRRYHNYRVIAATSFSFYIMPLVVISPGARLPGMT